MIKVSPGRMEASLGNGDICVIAGNIEDVGVVAFYPQEPRPIGSAGAIRADNPCDLDEFPLVMTFSNVESLDVVIEALQEVKELMIKQGTTPTE